MIKSLVGLMLVKSQSSRLPNKNTLDFAGKEMFLWNLEKCVSIFDEVYVSSDSYSILELASLHGAKAIHRGDDLCGDTPDIEVFKHALTKIDCDAFIAVHANNPTVEKNLIVLCKKGLEMGIPEVMTCHPMTTKAEYKKQANRVYGSIRGMTRERLENYPEPYHPNPEMLLVDTSLEIETIEDLNLCLLTHQS